MAEPVSPIMGAKSFNCPHCNALAHQKWFDAYALYTSDPPSLPDDQALIKFIDENKLNHEYENTVNWAKKYLAGRPFGHRNDNFSSDVHLEMFYFTQCFSCEQFSIWVKDKLVFPFFGLDTTPNEDMPADARESFIEASLIFKASPRGAAALLRLALQQILIFLGQPGKFIDKDIGALVALGMPIQIQQALDVVRVIGNNAVHPGQIVIDDNRDVALKLFSLLNIITEAMITQPRQIGKLFEGLPPGAREAIEKRDKPKP
ncbi:DUF4145 domain-containing protein [Methylobacterium sp. WL30]|uniref:DUF4145 domain-containing protein n=1 Tax=unclassified Methylobacterium TaxID=2615210 RepID=UPI0011CBFDDB|nr:MULTISPECIES: DUF4145 domain-containing protein [unclassified Methylobacterium]TXN40448.1 DUF4145 domain-containing protein [Methylobacterium sp. WL93]TXN49157.1 DUF4145 domain-containing protein [Methylobacterium sp. WL119]TXN68962.1 DUF4145 domain-containing protein [Methylobacterium sp. WL30]